jgi:hypothetical protein
MPREPLDTPEDLPKEALRQVAFDQLAFGQWLSASWRTKDRACRIRRPPVLKSRCCKLVSDQL